MARVTIFAIAAGTFKEGIVRGKPADVAKLDTVPGSFAAAGSPDYVIPAGACEAVIIITDTAIDFVIVRTNNPPTAEDPIPVPIVTGGLSQYIMFLEDGDNDLFIRAMA